MCAFSLSPVLTFQIATERFLCDYHLQFAPLPTGDEHQDDYSWLVEQLARELEVCLTFITCFRT